LQFDQFCEGVLIPLPPLNEQKRIVAKLDAIMPRIEAVKARLDKVPGILKRLRQSVLTAAVTGKLTEQWRQEHPEVGEWEEAQLSDLSELITKGASPTWQGINYVESPEVLFVTSENVYTRELRLEQKKYVELAFNQKQQRSILRKGDLLTNIVGASIGRTAVYDLDSLANVNQAVAIIRLRNQKEIPFYLYYLNCPEYLDKLNKEKVDVARANISLTDLKNMLVPHPQLSEQKEIVRQVDKLFALADKVETHYQKAKARVDKLSQSVLAKAFRGELVPQDPNDLPAAELLKQILAEKDKMAAQLKKRKTKNVKQRK
jgi:restriction endonuclease S subunit